VRAEDADTHLATITARVARRATGARWQRRALERLGRDHSRPAALALLLERYLAAVASGRPVHEWDV
jgi:hypothetical protein